MSPAVSVVVPSRGGAERLPVLLGLPRAPDPRRLGGRSWSLDGDIDGSAAVLAAWADRAARPRRGVPREPRAAGRAQRRVTRTPRARCWSAATTTWRPRPDYVRAPRAPPTRPARRGRSGMCRNVFPETAYAPRLRPAGLRAVPRAAPTPRRPTPAGATGAATSRSTARPGTASAPTTRATAATAGRTSTGATACTAAGVPITVVPGLETDHHIAATTTAGRALRAYYSGSARRRFEAKHGFQVVAPSRPRPVEPRRRGRRPAAQRAGHRPGGPRLSTALRTACRAWVAEKAVALTVEAGALAGYRRSDAGRAI